MTRLSRILTSTSVAGVLAASVVGLAASPAQADDANTLTVVGTSDVFDSNLVQSVIKPDFEAANPGKTLNYVSKGTGAAIEFAKQGTASAMIVHAAALENQFVAQGYSLEPYGRSIFWGDYVLAGPASDPAGVLGADGQPTDDITASYQKIAAAGAAGKADFVSRGGTPGTTVQEHAIWATTSGVPLCDVPASSGGGKAPYNGTGEGCGVDGSYPDWYHATGKSQGGNIDIADACNFPNAQANEGNDCYVFTDRGTLQYQQSVGKDQNLKIVTRSNIDTTAAKANLLVNSFHAYGINPDKFSGDTAAGINSALAGKFLDFITSPDEQTKIGNYLSSDGPDSDPPFLPSAAPKASFSALPTTIKGGTSTTIKGSISNQTPGTPSLGGVSVDLYATPTTEGGQPRKISTQTTNSNGGFAFPITPGRSNTYSIRTPKITKTENADLNPDFIDTLEPSTQEAGTITVSGVPSLHGPVVNKKTRVVTLSGNLVPKVQGDGAKLELYTYKDGQDPQLFPTAGSRSVKDGATTFKFYYTFPQGKTNYYVRYVNDGVVEPGRTAKSGSVTIP